MARIVDKDVKTSAPTKIGEVPPIFTWADLKTSGDWGGWVNSCYNRTFRCSTMRTFRCSTIRTFRYSTVKERAAIERRGILKNLRQAKMAKLVGCVSMLDC